MGTHGYSRWQLYSKYGRGDETGTGYYPILIPKTILNTPDD